MKEHAAFERSDLRELETNGATHDVESAEDLASVSKLVKALFKEAGLVVYIPDFVQKLQSQGLRIHGFGVKDPNDRTANYEVDVWRGRKIFLKSIYPSANLAFQNRLTTILTSAELTPLLADYTH